MPNSSNQQQQSTTSNKPSQQETVSHERMACDSTTSKESNSANFSTETIMTAAKARGKLAQFYEGKNIFITGATGFIGKIFLWKLMTSLNNCGEIYIMVRSKKGLTPQQRLAKMIQEAPFNRDLINFEHFPNPEEMRARFGKWREAKNPIDWTKVIAVEGDMSREALGLNDQIQSQLIESINIVFNIAASVQFDAPLKQNLRDNYLGARNLLNLSTKFKRLVSLVHVSTFYTNSHLSHIEEQVVPMNCECEKMSELISWMPDSVLETMAPQIMENRPNTYIFTKAMSENLVQKFQGQLPVAIVRPSIVVGSSSEPEPGWVDNVNGPMGLGVLASLGILRNIDWNYWGVSDFVPVDHVVNSMIVVAERTSRLYPKEIKVYNCSTSSANPTTWGSCFETLKIASESAPPYKMLRIPIDVPKHKRANKYGIFFTKLSEILFAYLVDLILVICGQKRLLGRLTSKLHHGYDILRHFTTTEYTCCNDNLLQAFDELDEEDQKNFYFDVRKINWEEGFKFAYYGARKRLLKEDLSNVPGAIMKRKIMTVVEFVLKIIFCYAVSYYIYKLYNNLSNISPAASSHPALAVSAATIGEVV